MTTDAQPCHVYQITNRLNGMQYIGVSTNVKRRFASHCRDTKSTYKSHLNYALVKHGSKQFELKTLLTSTRQYCLEMEAKLIKVYNTLTPTGYNYTGGNDGPIAARSGERSPMYGKTGELCASYGRKHLPTSIEKMKQAHAGKKNSMYGKSGALSPTAKSFVAIDPSGIIYKSKSLSAFSEKYGLLPSGMKAVAIGKRNHHRGWKVQYV